MSSASSAAGSSCSGTGSGPSGSGTGSGSASASMSENVYECANCKDVIRETRYLCATCDDKHHVAFSFCARCEVKGRLGDHRTHKIKSVSVRPARAPRLEFQCSSCNAKLDGEIFACKTCADYAICSGCMSVFKAAVKEAKGKGKSAKGSKSSKSAKGPSAAAQAAVAAKKQGGAVTTGALASSHPTDHSFGSYSTDELPPAMASRQRTIDAIFTSMYRDSRSPYIRVSVNGEELDALVDTGAEATVITVEAAVKCGLQTVDATFAGVAHGVGSSLVHGLVHDVPLAIGDETYLWPMKLLDKGAVEVIIGMDFLRAHRARIDVAASTLTLDSDDDIEFVAWHDLK